ncbi:MAG: hypothetical protein J6R47_02910 [Acholeplasmatales bacterium]|nr:hypothetical protein [Acholeplasmatales bacterium]
MVKLFKRLACLLLVGLTALGLGSCSFGDEQGDTLFIYLLNYYAQEGQNFTAKWEGMKEALEQHGIVVEGDNDKDAKKFTWTRKADSDLPENFNLVFVNNQTWDTSLALTNPLSKYQPIAIISTCNGVEFCSDLIDAYSPDTENATLGGFSDNYRQAMEEDTLHFLGIKHAASVGPIVAATYSALTGNPLRTENNEAIRISQEYWLIQSLEQYDEMKAIENFTNPAYKKSDFDKVLPYANANATYTDFYDFVNASEYEDVKAVYTANRDVQDTPVTTEKFKVGLLHPGSVNDAVGAYLSYIEEYMGPAYNIEFKRYGCTTQENQTAQTQKAIDDNCDAIISLQDDTYRTASIQLANENKVYFAIAGNSQNDKDYNTTKDLPYYVGAIGSSLESERNAMRTITNYYLEQIIERAKQQ